MLNADMIYEAADYLRLSKEDGDFSLSNDKLESDSISSQRAIIERFVAQNQLCYRERPFSVWS